VVVVGSYSVSAPRISVTARIVHVATGDVVTNEISGELPGLADIEAGLAHALAAVLGPESLDASANACAFLSIDAWRETAAAQRALAELGLEPWAAGARELPTIALADLRPVEDHLRAALASDPTYADALATLGLVQALSGRVAEAGDALRKAKSECRCFCPAAVLGLSLLQVRLGRVDDALATMRQAINHHPGFLEGRIILAQLLSRLGQHADALGEINYSLAIAPEQPAALAQRGYEKSKLCDLDGAVRDSERAVDFAPGSRPLRAQLAGRRIDAEVTMSQGAAFCWETVTNQSVAFSPPTVLAQAPEWTPYAGFSAVLGGLTGVGMGAYWSRQSEEDRDHAITVFSISAVLLATGAVLWVWDAASQPAQTPAGVSLEIRPGGLGLTSRWAW
jgi:tetratricopeptide (TPR) repeat protein